VNVKIKNVAVILAQHARCRAEQVFFKIFIVFEDLCTLQNSPQAKGSITPGCDRNPVSAPGLVGQEVNRR